MPFTMRVKRASMWSRARKLSGTITRSTDECEMSRSCQSATFSSEARAFVRTRRARPATCSQPTGFLLWGMAEEPFWPEPKGSSTSRTSVFWRARISVANFSRLAAIRARVVITSACRSRWRTCDETGAGSTPSRAQTASSTSGGRCEKVPTAPDSLPNAMLARARSSRARCRCSSACHRAIFRPKVMGSAWTPWVRPIIGACLWRRARSCTAAIRSRRSARTMSQASRIRMARAVSTTSEEVRP